MFERQTLHGAWFATAAYVFWGVAPVYFKLVRQVSPLEIVSQRIVWSVVLLLGLLGLLGRFDTLRLPRVDWWKIVLSAALLSVNWLTFIYAVLHNDIVETSLGYFINPLVSVLLGMLFLHEQLRPLQWCALGIAATGIAFQLVYYAHIPWIALTLAFSFGFYGLTRKRLGLHAVGGLALETMILSPAALAWLVWLAHSGKMQFFHAGAGISLLLMMAGIVTSFPLLCFAAAVRRLSLTAAGMFQYIAPSLSLIIAVIVYHEPFGIDRRITFTCIWIALAIFTAETLYHHHRLARQSDRKIQPRPVRDSL